MNLIPRRTSHGLFPLSILCLSALTHSSSAATLTVSNLNDSGAGSLRQALANAAQADDVIVFAPGVTGTITLTSGELFFTKSVTITGPGATNLTISGNNVSRVFSVSSGIITLSGLRIANGFVTGNPNSLNAGGGILNNSARLTVRHCEIVDNVHAGGSSAAFPVTAQGGGVWHVSGGDANTGGRLLLQNCTFRGNQAIGGSGVDSTSANGPGGDAAPAQGGGLFVYPTSANSVTVQDCTFTNNSAIGGTGGNGNGTGARGRGGLGQGGAVFVGENTLLISQRSTFKRNQAIGGSRGTGNNTASSNPAEGQGGAFYVIGFAVITDCTLDDNRATGGSGIDGTALSGAPGKGGGLFFGFGVVNLTRGTVINNVAQGGAGGQGATGTGEGGGLFVRFNGNQLPLHLINSTVALNIARAGNAAAGASGGGVWTEEQLNVTNSTIAFNVVLGDATSATGGGLRVVGGATTLHNTLVAENAVDQVASDAHGAIAASSSHNLLGVGSGVGFGVTGIMNGVNNNQIGTSAAPIDPKLHGPVLSGGLTPTCSIDSDSPAVNAGNDAAAPPTDQRGFLRSGVSDIGAFEFSGLSASLEILAITRVGNGPVVLQGLGVPLGVHRIQASPDLSPNSFFDLPPTATADAAGLLQYQDAATNVTQRFYRLAFP